MGWIYTKEPVTDVAGFLRQEFPELDFLDLIVSSVEAVVYACHRRGRGVHALVFAIDRYPTIPGKFSFGYRMMDETFSPPFVRCPEVILDRLTETTDDNARRWRDACRAWRYQYLRREMTKALGLPLGTPSADLVERAEGLTLVARDMLIHYFFLRGGLSTPEAKVEPGEVPHRDYGDALAVRDFLSHLFDMDQADQRLEQNAALREGVTVELTAEHVTEPAFPAERPHGEGFSRVRYTLSVGTRGVVVEQDDILYAFAEGWEPMVNVRFSGELTGELEDWVPVERLRKL